MKMRPIEICNEHFQKLHKEKNEFACKYCGKRFFKHITRMSQHFRTCEDVPLNIREPFVEDMMKRAETASKDRKHEEEITISERNALWEKFARAVYTSGVPFSIVENKYWIEFFQDLRPSFNLPTRKSLSEGLLDAEYNRVKEEVKRNIETIPAYGIQLDAWTNIRYEPIVNTVVTTPEPILYKSDYTKTHHHTGDFFASEIKKSIVECGIDRCFSVCTDNASAMTKAWGLLENDPELKGLPISFYGCAAHSSNLLANDILKQPTCNEVMKKITTIITTVNGSQVLKERLKEIQKETNISLIALILLVKTRWCYIVNSIQSVLKSRISLVQLAKCPKIASYLSENVRKIILDEQTWIEADQLCFLLQPIKVWISALESDKSIISKIPHACQEIFEHLRTNLPLSFVTEAEERNVLTTCKARFSQMMRPIHYAGNILDPEFQGNSLSPEQKIIGFNHILRITLALKLPQEMVHRELTNYMNRTEFWGKQLLWDIAVNLKNSPRVWWSTVSSNTLLSKVAAVILAMPPTSAATERTFSLYSHIHTKKRNRLTTDRAGKVVFIGRNLQHFYRSERSTDAEDSKGMDFNDLTKMTGLNNFEHCEYLFEYFKEY